MSRRITPKPDYYTQREWNRIQERERSQKRAYHILIAIFFLLLSVVLCLAAAIWYFLLRSHDTELHLPYDYNSAVFGIGVNEVQALRATPFAEGLCVTDSDVDSDAIFITAKEGALFDISNEEVIYAKNIFEQRSPASLTKIMTALVALRNADTDETVTVGMSAFDIDEESSVCGLRYGDRLSLKQLLYGMLIASGNDAAQVIAEYVGGGSIDVFINMMNSQAAELGASHTNFMNAHGLTADGHYTCAYDIYLIMNAAMKYDLFLDIIQRKNYYAEYKDADGDAYAITWDTTDLYLSGEAPEPDNVIVYGGKTGTTDDAGACLALISKDFYGNPFISVILHSESKSNLYLEMNQILSLVPSSS